MNRDPRAGGTGPVYAFGVFRLDPAERTLLRDGQPVALTPKAFDLLTHLVERHGRLVQKQELLSAIWPDAVVEEGNLTYNISILRKSLGDGGEDGKFIETVPTRGYRFVAPVAEAPSSGSRRVVSSYGLAAATILLIIGVAATVLWFRPKSAVSNIATPAPVLRRLIANPLEGTLIRAEISPDGRYLAYSDRTGIRVQVIDSGDVQTLPDTRGKLVLGWSGDGTNIRVLDDDPGRRVWDLSLVGNVRRWTGLVWPDPDGMSIGPDGSSLRLMPDGELRLNRPDGASRSVARIDNNWIRWAKWSPDAKRVVFLRGEHPPGLETFAVEGGEPSVVFKPPRDQYVRVMGAPGRDGRLIALLGRRTDPAVSVWELRTDTATGALVGEPRQLTDWRELGCDQISSSADGRRVALLTATHQYHVYVAGFDQGAARLDTPRRLAQSDFEEWPTAWTPDNRSVIFTSRHGLQMNIYRRSIEGGDPKLLVTGPDDIGYPRVSGDGRWLLFRQTSSLATANEGWRVMRAPVEGGLAEEVYAGDGDPWPQCSISGGCVVVDLYGGKTIISSLDPLKGKGAVLATLPPMEDGYVMPSGTEFFYLAQGNHIRIVSFRGMPPSDITVRDASVLANPHSLPDGSGWLSVNRGSDRAELLYITRDGRSRVLWAPDFPMVDVAIPSPDGRHLAIGTDMPGGSVWLMADGQSP